MDRFLPESTRWLISKRRYAEAEALINQAAKMENKSLPAHLITAKEEESLLIKVMTHLSQFEPHLPFISDAKWMV